MEVPYARYGMPRSCSCTSPKMHQPFPSVCHMYMEGRGEFGRCNGSLPLLCHLRIAVLCCISRRDLAGEDAGAGDLVVGDGGPVDGDLDSGVGSLLTIVSMPS